MFEVYHRNYTAKMQSQIEALRTVAINVDGRSWVLMNAVEMIVKGDLRLGGDEGVNLNAYRQAFRDLADKYEQLAAQPEPPKEAEIVTNPG